MSGIAGILQLDGRPLERRDLQAMLGAMEQRGPDGSGIWRNGTTGLVHAMFQTTPESLYEQQPYIAKEAQLAIVADARIDNRDELRHLLGLDDRNALLVGDAKLILLAYEKWGQASLDRLVGDFAFAIWDGRARQFFCARDRFGVKPFYYYHAPHRCFVFASMPAAIVMLSQVPYGINEGRIADFLITQLEGIDKTSTFFEEIYRLPPAYCLMVDCAGLRLRRYWELESGPELKLSSDAAYVEAFLDVFIEAVQCRLRGPSVGSMLSGGMDSGAIVAVARELSSRAGRKLPTVSALGPDPENCVETRTIHAALMMDGLDPELINYAYLDELLPDLETLMWNMEEPFDSHMTLVRAVYLAGRRRGLNVLLDGIDGDTVLSEGSYLARLLRQGCWVKACREAIGQNRFWGSCCPAWHELLYRHLRIAFVPEPMRRIKRSIKCGQRRQRLKRNINASMISPAFAKRVRLVDRLEALDAHSLTPMAADFCYERARAVAHPYLTVGVERYDRVASVVGVEPRHPFLDQRVVAFCVALPGEQKMRCGWPKAILRRSMVGKLPDAVRWRPGKEHLGWLFTAASMQIARKCMREKIECNIGALERYVDIHKLKKICRSYFEEGDSTAVMSVYESAQLAAWLRIHERRPRSGVILDE